MFRHVSVSGRRALVRRAMIAALSSALIASLLPIASVSAAKPEGLRLSKPERRQVMDARARGQATIRVLVATEIGAANQVVSELKRLGGRIEYRHDKVGYIRAAMPLARVEATGKIEGVRAYELEQIIPLIDPRPGPAGAGFVNPQSPPNASTPQINPYMPIGDTGAAQFMQAHPTWDGRGVTIGVLDTGTDLGHASLMTTSTGERKTVDWVTYTDPTDTSGLRDATWVRINTAVSGPAFSVGEAAYTAPAGAFKFGVFNERDSVLGGEVGNDVNRDGNPAGSSGLFPVLYDAATNLVRVDTDQDEDFTDEAAITDYKTAFDVDEFGTDDPGTALRESMPFVVQTDRAASDWINIGIPSGAHGSHVAGIASGNALFGGQMTGAAPGAKLVSVRVCLFVTGCSNFGLAEGMIYAASVANVDIINMSIGGLPSLNDGNNARAVLYENLIDVYGVQLVFSAGNSGPGINTIGDPAVTGKVIAAAAYITRQTWRSNYGSDLGVDESLHPFTSPGPREDGGFKPDVAAPGAAVSTTPTWQAGQPTAGVYSLPPGYGMFNGTSMASPAAAGAAALLVSAANQSGVEWSPERLRIALKSSARFLPNQQALEQGNGLIRVASAWDMLRKNPRTDSITSRVASGSPLASFLAEPGFGPGIYDRENVTIGDGYTRQYRFVRTTGGGAARTYTLQWVGNDGTFGPVPATISLARNAPRTVDIAINPTEHGVHSAILNVDDPKTVGIDYQTMNVVVVPYEFSADANYAATITGTVGRNQVLRHYFRVPAGTPALKVDFSGPTAAAGTGQARFMRFHPFGVPVEASTNSLTCYSPPVDGGPACDPNSRTQASPQAGVWEVTVEARRTSDVATVPFSLTASILGATVSPNPDTIASATLGVPVDRSYTLTNTLGTFSGRATGTTLGSASIQRPTVADGAVQEYPVTVPAGSTSLRATIGNTSDQGADLDLFLYRCTAAACGAGQRVLVGQNADGDSNESITLNNPVAADYRVVVDGFAVPAGTTEYDYIDVFVNPALGTISVTDTDAVRAAGASWTVAGTVTAASTPAVGRVLYGNVLVRTAAPANILVGRGDVIVQSVSP
jgi:hypothetical protein